MTGKGHVLSGTILATDVLMSSFLCKPMLTHMPDVLQNICSSIASAFDVFSAYEGTLCYVMIGVSVLLYYVGLLLPDIDNTSTISSFLHFKLPLRHRGFTHSLWFVAILAVVSYFWVWPLRFLTLGVFVHDFFDSFSKAGWVPFYPLGSYRIVHDKIVCATGRHLAFYSTKDEGSEGAFNITFLIVSVLAILIGIFTRFNVWEKMFASVG